MVHKPSEYWANFGRFKDKTDEARTRKGPSSTEQIGAKYDFHEGDAVGEQKGNKSTIQTGWSNSYLRGFSFSTTLGQSTSTTVGNSFSNHTGFKYTGFFGPEMTVLVSMGFKITGTAYWEVAKGGKYETGTTKAYVAASDQRIVDVITELSTAVYHTSVRLDQKCTTIEQAAVDLSQRVTNLNLAAAVVVQKLGALDTRVAGTSNLASLSMMITAQTYLKIKSGGFTSIE